MSNNVSINLEKIIQDCESHIDEIEQVQCEVVHRFGPGIYIRELQVKAGSYIVGHYHKQEHQNIMLKGHLTLVDNDGNTTDIKAPFIGVGKPGRKMAIIHEDTVWLNIYATEETDIETLEDTFLAITSTFKSNYQKLLEDHNKSAIPAKQIAKLPNGGYKIHHKYGKLYATADIIKGEIMAKTEIDGVPTVAGLANKSDDPNAEIVNNELIAIKPIKGMVGGLVGEEITI
jgi:hypothetical protein